MAEWHSCDRSVQAHIRGGEEIGFGIGIRCRIETGCNACGFAFAVERRTEMRQGRVTASNCNIIIFILTRYSIANPRVCHRESRRRTRDNNRRCPTRRGRRITSESRTHSTRIPLRQASCNPLQALTHIPCFSHTAMILEWQLRGRATRSAISDCAIVEALRARVALHHTRAVAFATGRIALGTHRTRLGLEIPACTGVLA